MTVPAELATLPQWVCWKYVTRKGKTTKVPHRAADGRLASTTNPEDWCSLEGALEATEQRGLDGVGFVFSKDDPYCGLDLDHCRNPDTGVVHPAAQAMIDELDSYTEVSPSGTGVHIILKAHVGAGRRKADTEWGGNFEVYEHGRYFKITGDSLNGQIIRVLTDFSIDVVDDEDEAVIVRCRKNSAGFTDLYDEGDTSSYGDDHSRADLALANILAARIDDPDQIERIMLRSALVREKWSHPDTGSSWLRRRVIEPALRDAPKKKGKESFWTGDLQKDIDQQVYMLKVRDLARIKYAQEQSGFREFPYPTPKWSLADELSLPPREHVWRVEGLQQLHANVVLIAGYKLGKTTLVMNLVRSLVDGTPFMNEFEVSQVQGNIAVFNYELHDEQWVDWARDMKIQNPEKIKPFHLRGLGVLQFWLPDVQTQLVEWMLENDIKYWVLDPTAQAWDTLLESEGDNIRASQFTRAIDNVKNRAGIEEANLTHHTSRASQDQGRGPSALEGWYDAGWFLTGKRDELKFHAIGRDVDVESVSIAYHEERHRTFLLDHRDEKEKVLERKNAKRTAIEALKELGPLSTSGLMKELKARDAGVSNTKAAKMFQDWVGAMDNPMAVRVDSVGNRKQNTFYLKGEPGHE